MTPRPMFNGYEEAAKVEETLKDHYQTYQERVAAIDEELDGWPHASKEGKKLELKLQMMNMLRSIQTSCDLLIHDIG